MVINADIVTRHYNYLDISVKRSAFSSQHITNKVSVYHAEWWGAGVVICLERGADLHMAHLIPLPLTVSCFSKIQIGLPFWYQLTWIVPEKGPLNGGVCLSRFFGFRKLCSILLNSLETILQLFAPETS